MVFSTVSLSLASTFTLLVSSSRSSLSSPTISILTTTILELSRPGKILPKPIPEEVITLSSLPENDLVSPKLSRTEVDTWSTESTLPPLTFTVTVSLIGSALLAQISTVKSTDSPSDATSDSIETLVLLAVSLEVLFTNTPRETTSSTSALTLLLSQQVLQPGLAV